MVIQPKDQIYTNSNMEMVDLAPQLLGDKEELNMGLNDDSPEIAHEGRSIMLPSRRNFSPLEVMKAETRKPLKQQHTGQARGPDTVTSPDMVMTQLQEAMMPTEQPWRTDEEQGPKKPAESTMNLFRFASNQYSSGSLIKKMSESLENVLAERSRYQRLNNTMKAVSGWKAYLYSYFPCLMKKSTVASIVNIAHNDIYHKFDFVAILQLMEDFKKLKRMLLTADQQVLFNLVPGDKLTLVEEDGVRKFKYQNHLDMMKGNETNSDNCTRDEVMAAYDRIRGQPSYSELDTNLLMSLNFLNQECHASGLGTASPNFVSPPG
jgi:hypothetical protein